MIECHVCNGDGWVDALTEVGIEKILCPKCNGLGKVQKED